MFYRKGIQLLREWEISICIEYFYKEKLTIGEKWLYQLEVFYNIIVLPIARERGNLLPDNIKVNQIDNCL